MSFEIGQFIQYDLNRCHGHNYGEPLYGQITDITYNVQTTEGEHIQINLNNNDIRQLDGKEVLKAKELYLKTLKEKIVELREEIRKMEARCNDLYRDD